MSGAKKTSAKDFKTMGLTPPEIKLWKALEAGEACGFDKNAPEEERTLRGDILGAILRRDAIEGVAPLTTLPRKAIISHAVITGMLDMSDIQMDGALAIVQSHFAASPNFSRSTFALLSFLGSEFKNGANFQDVVTKSDLFFRKVESSGELILNGAKIGGQFSADGAQFSNSRGDAINAQGAKFKDGVFLRETKLSGRVSFKSSKIEGHFVANGAQFFNSEGNAINVQSVQITDGIWLAEFPHPPVGNLNFTNADLGHVVIDENSYPLGGLFLRGARYSAIDDRSKDDNIATLEGWFRPRLDPRSKRLMQCYTPILKDISLRLETGSLSDKQLGEVAYQFMHRLDKKSRTADQHPFAYRQFARVLKANGHEREAKSVLVEAEHDITKRNGRNRPFWRVWRWLIKHLIAYGIEPWRVLGYVGSWWLTGFIVFYCFANQMTPSKERFYLSDNYVEGGGYSVRADGAALPEAYPTYNSFTYSLDVMLPVVDFAQESHWRPKNTTGWNWLRIFNRIFLAVGWALSTIAVLGFTGVIADRPIED